MMYKKVSWSYFANLNPNSGGLSFQFTTAPIVRNSCFRVVVTAGRFGIIQLQLPTCSSMPAGYEEKDGLTSTGLMINNSVVEFFVDSIQNMNAAVTMTVDQDGSEACNCSIIIQQVELYC